MKKAVVFILLGQSNAVGHGVPMTDEDKIHVPLTNVFGLSRDDNTEFAPDKVVWSGYTSNKMNLAEIQDDTYSVANCMARKWQSLINGGVSLPDLYIVHIAIGAQGVTEEYMWYVEREGVYHPGILGEANVSLYPFTCNILSRLKDSFDEIGVEPEYLIHWRGGENDDGVPCDELKKKLRDLYIRIFNGFYESLGEKASTVLHFMPIEECALKLDPSGGFLESLNYINGVFNDLADSFDNISLFDVRRAPMYTEDRADRGIFLGDLVHYTPEANMWVTDEIIRAFL